MCAGVLTYIVDMKLARNAASYDVCKTSSPIFHLSCLTKNCTYIISGTFARISLRVYLLTRKLHIFQQIALLCMRIRDSY